MTRLRGLMPPALGLMSLFSLPASGQADIAVMDEGSAEEAIIAACKSEEGAEPAKCDCYVAELKSLLPASDYRRSVILAALAMTNEALPMLDFIRSEKLDAEAFTTLMEGMEKALKQAEQRCGA